MLSAALTFLHLGLVSVHAQTYSATYLPSNAPNNSEKGQTGTNQCGTGSNQTSQCQNAYSEYHVVPTGKNHLRKGMLILVNSVDDFCVWAPPEPGPGSVIGNTEVSFTYLFGANARLTARFQRIEVAYCLKAGTPSISIKNITHHTLQSGYGTRLIPDGTITGAHFVQTPNYVQVTGTSVLPSRVILVTDFPSSRYRRPDQNKYSETRRWRGTRSPWCGW